MVREISVWSGRDYGIIHMTSESKLYVTSAVALISLLLWVIKKKRLSAYKIHGPEISKLSTARKIVNDL